MSLGVDHLLFDELSSKYGGFKAPTVKITVNNDLLSLIVGLFKPAQGNELLTDGVSITLNKDSASGAAFNLMNCYDPEKRSFRRELSEGAKISIQLGYGSELKTVFVGYVDTVSFEYSENPRVSVTAFDAVKLMLECGNSERTWDDGGFYTATISEIMAHYQDICRMPITNILPTLKKHGMLKQNSNNYSYVKDTLCKYCSRDLVVKAGEAYLIDPEMQFGKLTELGPGKGLLSLSVESGYKKVQAEVTGDKIAEAHASSTVITGASYKSALNKPTIISRTAPFKTSDECMTYAKRLAADEIRGVQTAKGSCIGIPDIVPGVGLGFSGVDSQWDGRTYFVDTATHSFSSSGYTVSFTTKGWK